LIWGLLFELLVLVGVVVFAINLFRTARRDEPPKSQMKSEAEMIAEVYEGLRRMEERVGALETLLKDRSGSSQVNQAGENRVERGQP